MSGCSTANGRLQCPRAGFTLVEVCLALGLISFSLLAILALMPLGLSSLREAGRQTVEADIVRRISAELLLLPYSEVDNYLAQGPFYFDNEGRPVDLATNAAFRIQLVAEAPSYPQAPTDITNSLRVIRVVTARPDLAARPEGTNALYIRNSGG